MSNNNIHIRFAKREDLEAIVNIYNQAIAAGQKTADTEYVRVNDRLSWFEEHSQAKYPLLVAEQNGRLIGYLTLSAYRPGRLALRHTAEVSYYVDFEHHHKGVASLLLQYAIDMCPSIGIKSIFAILIDNNVPSITLLEKFHFKKWGHLPCIADFDGVELGQYYYGLRVTK